MWAAIVADGAPTGVGLGIIAVILLAFAALAVAACVFAVRLIVRAVRRARRARAPLPGREPGPTLRPEGP